MSFAQPITTEKTASNTASQQTTPSGNSSAPSQTDVIDTINYARDHHQPVVVRFNAMSIPLQTLILNFDAEHALLTLDGLFPAEKQFFAILANQNNEALSWLQIQKGDDYLSLHVEIQPGHHWLEPTLKVAIRSYRISKSRRIFPRVHFNQPYGPQVEMTHSLPRLYGHVTDLSQQGCSVMIYGDEAHEQLQRNQEHPLRMTFNENWTLDIPAIVRQSSFSFRPCLHVRARFIFSALDADLRLELNQLVQSQAEHEDTFTPLDAPTVQPTSD